MGILSWLLRRTRPLDTEGMVPVMGTLGHRGVAIRDYFHVWGQGAFGRRPSLVPQFRVVLVPKTEEQARLDRVRDFGFWATWARHQNGGFLHQGGVPYLPLNEPRPTALAMLAEVVRELGPMSQEELDELARAWLALGPPPA